MFTRSAIRAATFSARTSAVRTFATRASFNSGKVFNYGTVGAAALTAAAIYQAINNKQSIQCQGSLAGVQGTETERTFIAVKPDGVQRALVGDVIARFEKRGYKLAGLKLVVPSKELANEHYADLSSKPFFAGLVDYMTNGKAPVVAMVWEGLDVIKQGRAMIGATNPLAAAPGTIRGDYCTSMGRNIIHGSDSFDSASKEIGLWFGQPGELVNWSSNNAEWIFSKN